MKKDKILILAWGVYPSTGGSTIIVNSLSEAFSPDQLVIAGQRPAKMPERKWESFSNIKLYYLDPFILNVRRKPKLLRWLKVFSIIKQVENIIKKEKITRIVAIFPDEYYTYIAYKVSSKLSIPYDVWFHNSYLENREGLLRILAKKMQPIFFDSAKRIFLMSDGLKNEMQNLYPNVKFETLVHGFNIKQNEKIDIEINGSKVKFLYSGSLNNSCLDASIRMMKVIKSNPNWELHIFAGNPESFHEHEILGDNVIFHKFLPIDEFVYQLKNYDIMLLPHGIDGLRSDFEYKTIFPTRTIPLLFSGKPILAHSPEGSFLSEFIIDNNCALLVTEKDNQKLSIACKELINNKMLRESLIKNALITSKQFELQKVAKKILDF